MKKILSAALVCLMLVAIFVVPTSAEQTNVDVYALKFTKQPTFDGVVSVEEWGEPTVTVKVSEASTINDDSVNEFNTFFMFSNEFIGDESIYEDMYVELWFRYDDDYFYLAAKVHDVDSFSAPNQGENTWNNDAIQFCLDPNGPDSVMLKDDPTFNYKETEFNYSKYNYSDSKARVFDGFGSLVDATFTYHHGITPQAFNGNTKKPIEGAIFGASYVEIGDGIDDFSGDIYYEIAMPWSTVGGTLIDNFQPDISKPLGMSLVTFTSSGSGFDAFLSWGCGICGGQYTAARRTSGGSNAINLSEETFTPADDYAIATETETETETEAPVTTAAPADSAEDTDAEITVAPSVNPSGNSGNSGNNTTDFANNNKSDSNNGWIIWAIIGVVVVAAVVLGYVFVAKKKKQ